MESLRLFVEWPNKTRLPVRLPIDSTRDDLEALLKFSISKKPIIINDTNNNDDNDDNDDNDKDDVSEMSELNCSTSVNYRQMDENYSNRDESQVSLLLSFRNRQINNDETLVVQGIEQDELIEVKYIYKYNYFNKRKEKDIKSFQQTESTFEAEQQNQSIEEDIEDINFYLKSSNYLFNDIKNNENNNNSESVSVSSYLFDEGIYNQMLRLSDLQFSLVEGSRKSGKIFESLFKKYSNQENQNDLLSNHQISKITKNKNLMNSNTFINNPDNEIERNTSYSNNNNSHFYNNNINNSINNGNNYNDHDNNNNANLKSVVFEDEEEEINNMLLQCQNDADGEFGMGDNDRNCDNNNCSFSDILSLFDENDEESIDKINSYLYSLYFERRNEGSDILLGNDDRQTVVGQRCIRSDPLPNPWRGESDAFFGEDGGEYPPFLSLGAEQLMTASTSSSSSMSATSNSSSTTATTANVTTMNANANANNGEKGHEIMKSQPAEKWVW